jgi:[Skp1-protein]-hydroxyproline N-acetylglucosaminyltransferase
MKSTRKNAIIISLASYRDKKCSITLESCFKMAKNPENVFVAICQQNAPGDDECVSDNRNIQKYKNNIRTINLDHTEARGPTYARYLCATLWDGEEYFLQIDSHTLFAKDWDVKCIEMIQQLKSSGVKKPVLSHYPKSYNDQEKDDDTTITRICEAFINKRDMISFKGAQIKKNIGGELVETPFMAAGMIFCESKFLEEIPFDPLLPYLFVGEEILHSARFWTSGWNIFTPNKNIVYHYYTRKGEDKIWTDNPTYSDIPAFNKVKLIMELGNKKDKVPDYLTYNIKRYGLGKERSLQDYYKFIGLDFKTKTISKNFCKN